MAALPHDSSGFLVGERLVKGVDLVGKDTAEILKILRASFGLQVISNNRLRVTLDRINNKLSSPTIDVTPTPSPVPRLGNGNGNSGNANPLPTVDVGAPPDNRPMPPTRELGDPPPDSSSDTAPVPPDTANPPPSNEPSGDGGNAAPPDVIPPDDGRRNNGRRRNALGQFEGDGSGGLINSIKNAIRNGFSMGNADTRNIDPTVDAVRELGDMLSPLAKVGKTMFKGVSWLFGRKKKQPPSSDQDQRQQSRIEKLLQRIAGSRVGQAAGSGFNLFGGLFSSLAGTAGGLLSGLGAMLKSAILPALGLTAAFKFGEWLGGKIYDFIEPALSPLIDGIAAIPDKISKAWDGVIDIASKGIEAIVNGVKGIKDKLVDAYDATVATVSDTMEKGANQAFRFFNWTKGVYQKTVSKVADGMQAADEKVQGMLGGKTNSVVNAGGGYTDVKQSDGSVVRRTGARNWRNNNPGNIRKGDYANSMGAIGDDGAFAVFPDYETGRKAKESLIFDSNKGKALSTKADYGEGLGYKDKTLKQMIAAYAPPEDKNDLAAYQNKVLSVVGGVNKRMSEYTPQERQRIMTAMEQQEGFKVGKESVISPATAQPKPAASVAVNQAMPTQTIGNLIADPLGFITTPMLTTTATKTIAPNIPMAAPKTALKPMPEVPKQKQQVSTKEQKPMQMSVVDGNESIGQNLSDRHLAHVVTGGLGMDALRHS